MLKARDALNVLESFSDKWLAGEYVEYRHEYLRDLGLAAEVSGESDSVANDPKRMFWLDDGRQVYCENHIKNYLTATACIFMLVQQISGYMWRI